MYLDTDLEIMKVYQNNLKILITKYDNLVDELYDIEEKKKSFWIGEDADRYFAFLPEEKKTFQDFSDLLNLYHDAVLESINTLENLINSNRV